MESHLSALRLATLEQRHFQLHSTALEQLTEHLNGLDALCRTLGVNPLSRFVDPTALEFAEASRMLRAEDRGPVIPDCETGMACGIEDMAWLPASTGMTTLEALSAYLQRNSPRELAGARHPLLLADLA